MGAQKSEPVSLFKIILIFGQGSGDERVVLAETPNSDDPPGHAGGLPSELSWPRCPAPCPSQLERTCRRLAESQQPGRTPRGGSPVAAAYGVRYAGPGDPFWGSLIIGIPIDRNPYVLGSLLIGIPTYRDPYL